MDSKFGFGGCFGASDDLVKLDYATIEQQVEALTPKEERKALQRDRKERSKERDLERKNNRKSKRNW